MEMYYNCGINDVVESLDNDTEWWSESLSTVEVSEDETEPDWFNY